MPDIFDAMVDEPRKKRAKRDIFDALDDDTTSVPAGATGAVKPGPGFMESLAQVPGQALRILAAGGPAAGFNPQLQMDQAMDMALAESGDPQAAARQEARGVLASTAATVMLPPGVGLAARTGLGALGGALGGGLESASRGEGFVAGTATGAAYGAGGGLALGVAGKVVQRLVRLGRPVPARMAEAARQEAMPASVADPVKRVVEALKVVPDLRKSQEALRTTERGKRIKQFAKALRQGEGEEGARAAMGTMAGELPAVQFGSLRPLVGKDDIQAMFNIVRDTPLLGDFERLDAIDTLKNLFNPAGHKIPNKSSLKILERAFGPELVVTLMENQKHVGFLKRAGLELANAPRALMASFDLSAPLRQGLFAGAGHPKEFVSALGTMFKVLKSDDALRELEANIVQRPTYELMTKAKLALTKAGSVLGDQEEAFMGRWAQKVPGVKASERAYTGFLNKLRADVFDSMAKDASRAGTVLDDKALQEMGAFINAATGRGNLPEWAQKHAYTMNAALFSPRLMASRVQLLSPGFYITQNKTVRNHAIRSALSLGAMAYGMVQMAALAGADTETDPTSSDWGKLKFGNTRYDILGGFQQYLTLGARMFQGVAEGEGFSEKVVGGVKPTGRFLQNKLAPLPSLAATLAKGTDFQGNEVSVPVEVMKRFTPIMMQDVWEEMKQNGWIGLAKAAPAVFGVGVNTYND